MRPSLSPLSLLLPALLLACSGSGKDDDDTGRPPKDEPVDDSGTDDDADNDGYTSDDCDDTDASIHPGAEDVCDDVDNDCDGATDEDARAVYADADADGYGDANAPLACDEPGATNSRDCDDTNPDVFPGADESCNGGDDDCDGTPDNGLDVVTSYRDNDGDASGDPNTSTTDCQVPAGYVSNDNDCNDRDASSPAWVQTTGRSGARGTPDDPYSTIQEGISSGASCVRVGPGTYYESINYYGYPTDVQSTEGPTSTTIYATSGSAVTFEYGESSSAVLDGFTLTGSVGRYSYSSYTYTSDPYTYYYDYYYYYGGGIYISGSSPTLRNLVIAECDLPKFDYSGYSSGYDQFISYSYGYGGGMYITSGSPTLTDITFTGNTAGYGAGVYADSNSSIVGTRLAFLGNTGVYGTGFASGSYNTVLLENVIANANSSDYGYGAFYVGYETDFTMNHGTVVSNDMAVMADYYVSVTIENSILVGNNYGLYSTDSSGVSTFALSYNNVYSNNSSNYYNVSDPTGTNGNVQTAPKFSAWVDDTDYTNDDLTLKSSSGCVDAGDPRETDTDGSVADMGAYGGPNGSWP